MNKDFFQSKTFRVIILCLGIIIFSLLAFGAGVAAGYRKAIFSVRGGENYERNFIGPRASLNGMGGLPGNGFFAPHGTVGEVVSINGNTIAVKSEQGNEISVIAGTSTAIREFDQNLNLSNLVIGEHIVVIGEPNTAGQIEAKIIRVFPEATSTPNPQ